MGANLSDPFLTAVIPTRENEKDLIDCLRSLVNLDYTLDKMEVLIWDNDSSPECRERTRQYLNEMKKERPLNARLIESDVNYGGFTTRTELFKQISRESEFVLSLDDDVVLPGELLRETLGICQRDKKIGIVGPRIVYDDAPHETAHGAGFVHWWSGRYTTEDTDSTGECDYVIGCCMLIRKSVIDQIGGFDPDYFTSHGEVDFCLRAKRAGYKVVYCPDVRVRHRVDRGGTRTLERLYYVYRNKLFVIKKNAPVPHKWIALILYACLWFPKALLDSILFHGSVHMPEIKILTRAVMDGWGNRTGKRL